MGLYATRAETGANAELYDRPRWRHIRFVRLTSVAEVEKFEWPWEVGGRRRTAAQQWRNLYGDVVSRLWRSKERVP